MTLSELKNNFYFVLSLRTKGNITMVS